MGGGFVREHEGGFYEGTCVPAYELLPDLGGFAAIRVSNHDIDGQTSMSLPPEAEGIEEAVAGLSHAMEEITQHHESGTGVLRHELSQTLQVGNGRAPWQRDSRLPGNIVLAEMRVGDDERGPCRPQHSACRMQSHQLALYLDVKAFKRHGMPGPCRNA
jgi:hypothetical protein